MDSELKESLTSREAWVRGLFMVMFFILLELAKLVAGMVAVLQFLFTIFTSQTNDNLLRFGSSLSRYIYQAWSFLTYNTETQPFPFAPWPTAQEAEADEMAIRDEVEAQDEVEGAVENKGDTGQQAPGKD